MLLLGCTGREGCRLGTGDTAREDDEDDPGTSNRDGFRELILLTDRVSSSSETCRRFRGRRKAGFLVEVVAGVSLFMASEAQIGLCKRKATCSIFLYTLVSTNLAGRIYLWRVLPVCATDLCCNGDTLCVASQLLSSHEPS